MTHLRVAASEEAFENSFEILRDSLAWEDADAGDFGAFSAGYHIRGHLEGGSLDLRDDGSINIDELDVRWDQFEFNLGLDIPEICVGGGCVDLPWPLPDACLPRICIFDEDPDISISPDLAPFIAQEVSFTASLDVRHYDASAPPPPWFTPCALLRDALVNADAIESLPGHDQWHVFVDPQAPIDVDLFDFPDVVGDLIEDSLSAAIRDLIPGGWVRDLVLEIIGGIADFIRFLLDIPDEIDEWLSDLFNVSLGALDFLIQVLLDFFGNCVPIYRIDDPFELLPELMTDDVFLSGAPVTLVPVTLPIENLTASVEDREMVIEAEVGA